MTGRMRQAGAMALAGLLAACGGDRGDARIAAALGGEPRNGRALIERYGCGTCHVIPGIRTARGRVGPPLTRYGDRVFIAGALPNSPENLARWILSPTEIESTTAMPDLVAVEQEARDMAAYLLTLGDGDGLGPPHPLPTRWITGGGH